jgi:tetratricopeptide (TPR) repeat protein
MDSLAVRLAASLGMLFLLYWTTFMPKTSVPRTAEIMPGNIETLVAASTEHYQAERYRDALAPTEALVARYPAQHVYLRRLATIYQHLGRPREEAATWQRFIDVSPTPWEACPAVANAYADAHDAAGAFAATEVCWKLAPGDPDAAFALGRVQERVGKHAEAAAMYRRALDIDARHSDSQLGLARLDLAADRLDSARTAARAVVERYPKHSDAVLILGLVAQRQGDRVNARRYFERALALAKGSFDAHVGLGVIDFVEGNPDASRKHFERAVELDPSRRAEVAAWLERTRSTR